jgi:thiol-disulfide isomerase/thioredoxin
MKKILLIFLFILIQNSYCQDDRTKELIGKEFVNYTFESLNGIQYNLNNENKPKIIIISASWCGPCKFQNETINSIVEKYYDKIDFVTLFWDLKEKVKEMKSEYNEKIVLVPSKIRKENIACIEISGFKHCLGFPTIYILNRKNVIQNVMIGASTPMKNVEVEGEIYNVTVKEAKQNNFNRIEKAILELIK